MRTIGLLGGMSSESSIEYYRLLNQAVRQRLGGLHSAECVIAADVVPPDPAGLPIATRRR
jgi:aspartate racemase